MLCHFLTFKVHSANKFPTFKSGINMFSDLLIKELVFRQNLGQGFHGSTYIAYGVSSVSTRLFPLFHHEPQHKRATILRPHKYNTVHKSNAKDSFLPSLWCPIRFGLRALPSLEDCQILLGSLGEKRNQSGTEYPSKKQAKTQKLPFSGAAPQLVQPGPASRLKRS